MRVAEKRDVILGSTSFLKPNAFIDALANLLEASPLLPPPMPTVYVPWVASSHTTNRLGLSPSACNMQHAATTQPKSRH